MEKVQRDDVAVFVDFENVYVSVREKFDATPNFELIMDRCEDYGRIVIARAYADWYRYPRVTSALFANGVEPMYVPTYYYDRDIGRTGRPIKNSVDIHLCIDAMRTLYSQPHILKYVLVTGDRDFIPLVNAIRQQGKEVIIIGIGGAASAHLAQSGDEFLFYEQIADLKASEQALRYAEAAARPPENRICSAERTGERGFERAPEAQERTERTERLDRADRPERTERSGGRNGDRPDRGERNGDRSGPRNADRPERRQPIAEPIAEPLDVPAETTIAEPMVAAETETPSTPAMPAPPAAPKSPYDTLVDAIQLARQRGFVVNLGSLKVVMRELDSTFHELKVKDNNGKGFAKFKDFVKEAENRGKVQIFTNGTVTEVFLPGEDPYRLSQFAEDLAPQRTEQELDSELAQATSASSADAAPAAAAPTPANGRASSNGRAPEARTAPASPPVSAPVAAAPAAAEPAADEDEAGDATVRRTYTEREWEVFRSSMAQFTEPVRFMEIFNALRGLRNQEVVELTNSELKELVKQAINKGMLQRTGRGAKAYYRISGQYRNQRPAETTPDESTPTVITSATTEEIVPALTAARRSRMYDFQHDVGGQPAEAAPLGQDPALSTDGTGEVPAIGVEGVAPEAGQSKRRRRKPAADKAAAAEQPATEQPAAEQPAVAEPAAEQPKRQTRRRKPAAEKATAEQAAADKTDAKQSAAPAEQPAETKPKRHRKRPPTPDEGQG